MEPHEPKDLRPLLEQLLDSQREQAAAIRQLAGESRAVQQQMVRWQRRIAGLLLLVALVIGVAAGAMAIQISRHANTLFQLWDETYPLHDDYEDEPPVDSGWEHLI